MTFMHGAFVGIYVIVRYRRRRNPNGIIAGVFHFENPID